MLVALAGLTLWQASSQSWPAVNGARRWVVLAGMTFQPSELLKVAFVLAVGFGVGRAGPLVAAALALGAIGVALQPDVGTAAMLVAVAVVHVFAVRPQFGIAVVTIAAAGAALAARMAHVRARILGFVLADDSPSGAGYQIHQAYRGLQQAHWFGGSNAFVPLPSAAADFAFITLMVRCGLAAGLIVLALLVATAVAERRAVALEAGPEVPAKALSQQFLFGQAVVNLASVTGLVPVVGVPFPLLTAGGSSAMASVLLLGVCSRRMGDVGGQRRQ